MRDSLSSFFADNPKIYSASSLVAFLLSVAIILSVFSNRNSVNWSKIYFRPKKKQEYFEKLRTVTGQQPQPYVPEPWNITVKQLALLGIVVALGFYWIFIASENHLLIRAVSYIFLVMTIVASITIFTTALYLENDFSQRQRNKKDAIRLKLQEYFTGDVQIQKTWQETVNFLTYQHMVIQRGGKVYKVVVNPNDPDSYFTVDEIPLGGKG